MRTAKDSAKQIAFEITKFFEGGRYDAIAGNYDGQILSVGALQWNVGQGTLFPLIVRSWELDPDGFRKIFGASTDLIVSAARRGDRQVFLDMLDGKLVKRDWKLRWQRWGTHFQELQRTFGAEPYHKKALGIVEAFKFKSTRAYAWAFDLAVQNGGMGRIMQTALRAIEALRSGSEREKLQHLTELRGRLVREEFRRAYMNRKLAIVNGHGRVNGVWVDVDRMFGLSDEPWFYEEEPNPHTARGHFDNPPAGVGE